MLLADWLIPIGLAVASLGTILETSGPQQRTFWLRNQGTSEVIIQQGYTSCGCTTISYEREAVIAPGDSTEVTLRFNPQGRGGEFHESGTIVYTTPSDPTRRFVNIALAGTCITSEETLLRQYPIRLSDDTRLSADHFDLGRMSAGAKRELNVSVLHRDEGNRRERIPISFVADASLGKGLQHVVRTYWVEEKANKLQFNITFDIFIE